jgi:hypothetical protein
MSFIHDCALAGVADAGAIQGRLDRAIERGNALLERAEIGRALSALGAHLYQHGNTEGPTAVRIIEQAMQAA